MSFHWCDNLHTAVFSPRDFQVELLAAAFERNTMICLGHKSSKEFIALKLLQEIGRAERRLKNAKKSVYLSLNKAPAMFTMLQHLTDLKVYQESCGTITSKLPSDYNVYILQPETCLQLLRQGSLKMEEIHLLVLEDCHRDNVLVDIKEIFRNYYSTEEVSEMPKVLGLAGPLHSAGCDLAELSAMLNSLERAVQCKTETASDIVTVLRYCAKPFEYIVQCAPFKQDELCFLLKDILQSRKCFLKDHRYDPFEIYCTDEYLDELKDIPDPKKEPLEFIDVMLEVLQEMGPWSTDRVACNMYHRIEKQKIKTPHERHYILLCLVNTALLEVHAICEQNFRKLKHQKTCVEAYSSPKVRRLLEVLRLFKPEDSASKNDTMKRIGQELDQMDFQKLTKVLETKCLTVEQSVEKQQLESRSIVENLDTIVKPDFQSTRTTNGIEKTSTPNTSYHNEFPKRFYKTDNAAATVNCNTFSFKPSRRHMCSNNLYPAQSVKKRPFNRRHYRNEHDAADALCSIIFCNSNYKARVLYELLTEMSRHEPDYKFVKCQFTTDRVADPITDPKEAESEHRRQEEVLKRFRMHDCNILIATSVLEEGIDVPKCNLVVRWDPPTTYRSYVQCKGRARAVPAYHVILVASDPNDGSCTTMCGREQLSDKSHKMLCELPPTEEASSLTDSDDESDDENCGNHINGIFTKQKFVYGSSKGTIKILNPEVITNKHPSSKPACSTSPPTEIILKEIKDKPLAIENTKDVKDVSCLQSKAIINPNDLINMKQLAAKSSQNSSFDNSLDSSRKSSLDNSAESNGSLIESHKDFKVFDLNSLLSTVTKKREKSKVKAIVNNKNVKTKLQNTLLNKSQSENVETLDTTDCVGVSDNKTAGLDATCNEQNIKSKQPFQCMLQTNATADDEKTEAVASDMENFEKMSSTTDAIIKQMAEYREIEKMLLEKCANTEPAEIEHNHADAFNNCIRPYKPLPRLLTGASVDLSNSIALVNKYCAKLPSDTFTKLTPLWRCARTIRNNVTVYQYTIRLPINSPLKYDIVGLPMPSHILARRVAALQACIELHQSGELDNNLQPIGKEGFKAIEHDWENFELEEQDEMIVQENLEPRPGTTKRRQYYYKRIASEFCNCRPTAGKSCYLYILDLTLQCPIPEEQNTRGRKIYPPEDALQGFGILTTKKIPKVSSFPIFTRSGEVKVSLVLHPQRVVLNEQQISCINTFINYTFTKVLRLKKFLMLFDPESTENCVFIVPTIKSNNGYSKEIDWQFLNVIERNANMMPTPVPEDVRHAADFMADKFKDAVVMPWYRNQDQPHYFYVAEICYQLCPLSLFPNSKYKTFMHYYFIKYGLKIHPKQPLLDVDHTSARLNFLTPRYVNRKGVALPTSSEATKRAKRENLELKQILVPELCTVHPFPASLWRTAVCLPCILYRINGLLLADDIRKKVVKDMGLGQPELPENKEWPMLDFGWSLSDVLKKCKATKLQNSENDVLNDEKKNETKNDEKTNAIFLNDADKDQEAFDNCNKMQEDKTVNEIVQEAERKLQEEGGGTFVEIGTWSNDILNDEDTEDEYDELLEGILPPTIRFCGKAVRATSPTFNDVKFDDEQSEKPNFTCYETDEDESYADSSLASDFDIGDIDDDDIVLTAKNEAEKVETEQDIIKLKKQLSIIQATKANERDYQETKNLLVGFNFSEVKQEIAEELEMSIRQFKNSTRKLMKDIRNSGMLVYHNEGIKLPDKLNDSKRDGNAKNPDVTLNTLKQFIPYFDDLYMKEEFLRETSVCHALSLESLHSINLNWIQKHPEELFIIEGSGDIFDSFNDSKNLKCNIEKLIKINFENQGIEYKTGNHLNDCYKLEHKDTEAEAEASSENRFSFDYQPDISTHPGPSPSIILQALTMSNANDGINLERLETIGDSFLKYAITTYLYITYENVHEGKLSHLRSKQVANLNLYRLGRRKVLGEYMIATKFEPSDNWLPPCYYVPKELEKALIEAKIPPHYWSLVDLVNIKNLTNSEICELVRKKADEWGVNFAKSSTEPDNYNGGREWDDPENVPSEYTCFIPYNLVSQHSIPDKSVADCVEALIGAYLIECGLRGALLFMAWLGIRVIPYERVPYDPAKPRVPGSTLPDKHDMITVYGEWKPPKSPLLHYVPNAEEALDDLLQGYDVFEQMLGYKFRDRSYLLQAMTHASYTPNRLTDCYQRLEFLGDAVLDYLITRHLYEDPRQHSPGALTDLRSALVNNTIFASLAVRHGFHKYFRHLSPGLNEVIDRFVRIQTENGHSISEEYYLLSEEECDDAEDVEVPKALGDVFESVAGAIFLDSSMSLDAVWHVYYNMMRPEIEQFSNSVPKSPIRELLELEPETAKFGKPEKLADGRRVRVTVEVFCKGTYRGIGRNYRIAKCTAAKCALRQLKKRALADEY